MTSRKHLLLLFTIALLAAWGIRVVLLDSNSHLDRTISAAPRELEPALAEDAGTSPLSALPNEARGSGHTSGRKAVELVPPAEAAGTGPWRIEGRVVVADLGGSASTDLDGEIELWAKFDTWLDPRCTRIRLPVRDGRFELSPSEENGSLRGPALDGQIVDFGKAVPVLSVHRLDIAANRVSLDEPRRRYNPSEGPFVVYAHPERSLVLHIEDARTGGALDEVTLLRAPGWGWGHGKHPGDGRKLEAVSTHASSPIHLGSEPEVCSFFAHSPGYAWNSIELDLSRGGERQLLLVPGGDLEVSLFGNIEHPQATLRVRVAESTTLLPPIELSVDGRETLLLEGLAPNTYEVSVEVGERSGGRLVLAEGKALIRAGVHTPIRLEVAWIEPVEKVPLGGLLVVPSEWELGAFLLSLDRLGASVDGGRDRQKIRGPFPPVSWMPNAYEWKARDVPPGTYSLSFEGLHHAITVEVPAEGATNVMFEIPPPATVLVQLRAKDTGEALTTGSLYWRSQSGRSAPGRSLATIDFEGGAGVVEVTVPKGAVSFSARGTEGYGRASKVVEVVAETNRVVLELPRVHRVSFRFRDAETPVPGTLLGPVGCTHSNGTGKIAGWGASSEGEVTLEFEQAGRYCSTFRSSRDTSP